MQMSDKQIRRVVFFLFLFCAFIELRFTADTVRHELNVTQRSNAPFNIKTPGATLDRLQPEARAAGLEAGDRPVSLDGRPIPGPGPLMGAVRLHRPGSVVDVEVTRNGQPVSAKVTLAPVRTTPLPTSEWVLMVFLILLTPYFCMALG